MIINNQHIILANFKNLAYSLVTMVTKCGDR